MKALIHEIIIENHEFFIGRTYQVEDLDAELDRLEREPLVYSVTSAIPNVIIDGMEITIVLYI